MCVGGGGQTQHVFYNPIQQFNRDLSVLAIKAFAEDACERKQAERSRNGSKVAEKRRNNRAKKAKKAEAAGAEQYEMEELDGGKDSTVPGQQKRKREQDEAGEEADQRPKKASRVDDVDAMEGAQVSKGAHDESGPVGGYTMDEAPPQTVDEAERADQERVSSNGVAETAGAEPPPPKSWEPPFRILDALSATGLRALRYASEIPQATSVVANDRERNAVKSIDLNVQHNKLTSRIITTAGDAVGHMYRVAYPPAGSHGPNHVTAKYDVIDLDPYGTAVPFIDAALQALKDEGLLCVTCTDSGVFASCGYAEKTFSLYGGMPIKGLHSHEGGLRLILHAIATRAATHSLSIEPLLSLSIDFYARVFVRVRKSPQDVKFLAGKTMLLYECDVGCGAWTTQFIGRHQKHKNSETNWKFGIGQAPTASRQCEHCGTKTHIAGPMWGGPLHSAAFIEKLLSDVKKADADIYQTKPRLEGMLDTALDELSVNSDVLNVGLTVGAEDGKREIIPKTPPQLIDHHPFYFIPSALSKVIKACAPAEGLLKGALRHAGYTVTRSHCRPGSIKTDAPWSIVWEVMREWVRQKAPIKEGALKDGQAGYRILQAMRTPEQDEAHAGTAQDQENDDTIQASTTRINGVAPQRPDSTIDPKKLTVVFDAKLGSDKSGRRLVRYQQNPRENWGPMSKAKGGD